MPENVIILADGATDEIFSNLKPRRRGRHREPAGRSCREPDGRPLASREIYLVVNQPIPDPRPGRPTRRFLQLRGIDDPRIAAAVHVPGACYPGRQRGSPEAGVQRAARPTHADVARPRSHSETTG